MMKLLHLAPKLRRKKILNFGFIYTYIHTYIYIYIYIYNVAEVIRKQTRYFLNEK